MSIIDDVSAINARMKEISGPPQPKNTSAPPPARVTLTATPTGLIYGSEHHACSSPIANVPTG